MITNDAEGCLYVLFGDNDIFIDPGDVSFDGEDPTYKATAFAQIPNPPDVGGPYKGPHGPNKCVLGFKTVESLDILIGHLLAQRNAMRPQAALPAPKP